MRIPKEQCSPYGGAGSDKKQSIAPAPATATSIHQRQGDRNNCDDDDAAARRLPVFVRYRDLKAAGLVANWPTLLRMIDEEGFPEGRLLSPNVRAWMLDEVERWLETRPTARKVIPRPRNRRRAAADAVSARATDAISEVAT